MPPSSIPSPCTQPLDSVGRASVLDHLPRLRSIARRMLGCDHLADDAIQESLVALWHGAHTPTNVGAWLARTVVHRCQHIRRTARRRHHHEHIASGHCELHRGCDNPLHIAIAHETGQVLEQVLDTLPAEQREALQLYEQANLDYRGIAAHLALPIGTVRSRLARARTAVATAIRRHLTAG